MRLLRVSSGGGSFLVAVINLPDSSGCCSKKKASWENKKENQYLTFLMQCDPFLLVIQGDQVLFVKTRNLHPEARIRST